MVEIKGPVTLRLTFKNGQVARIPHVELARRWNDGTVSIKTYGNEPAVNKKVLKCEVFSE